MSAPHLSELLDRSAAAFPDRVAVEDERDRRLTFAELRRAADRLATRLARWNVGRGDRVGLFTPKSIEAVAAIQGVLRSGAAYVPVDPLAPVARGAGILADAGVKAVVVLAQFADSFRDAWPGPGPLPRLILLGETAAIETGDATWAEIQAERAPSPLKPPVSPDDLAYILYTSGSTGTPKGVMLSHANAFCFIDWCAAAFSTTERDRFSSHAPFHFDLSVFDLYVACRQGATLVLIGESLGKDPVRLGDFLRERRIDVWYSAPSILTLLTQRGGIDRAGFPAPRLVLFAGEVFPIKHLRRLREQWPAAEFWNLYGPTETNVCTAYRIPEAIEPDRETPFPIGSICPPLRGRVVDENDRDVPSGTIGELIVAGPGVTRGYFGREDLTARAFSRDERGVAWYRTGDLVVDLGGGCYDFRGRRDRMVKKRGYRIELGEIESALHRLEGVDRAAVVAKTDPDGVSIRAFVALKDGRKGSIIAMKKHCTLYLPHYMIPDSFSFVPSLPATSTDKVDYQNLQRRAEEEHARPQPDSANSAESSGERRPVSLKSSQPV